MTTTARAIRIIRHEESFEVRYADGSPSVYFYYDDHPGRRAITGRDAPEVAEEKAKAFARNESDKFRTKDHSG